MTTQEWTPRRGICKALVFGAITASILSLLLAIPAALAPLLLTTAMLRAFITVAVAWVCFSVVHSTAGMVGGPTTWIASTCTFLVMLSNHAVWAIFGAPRGNTGERVAGWAYWFDPAMVVASSLFVFIPLAICIALFRHGVPGPSFMSSVLTSRIWGPR